ncbi:hypothetical protein DEJ51_30800 [Streptomyces venezuelae]|uniref:Uncharacterized protein n=1 Tax=Streptomyces venezuelae TaxID=54571 RepID=A0A5P2DTZ9_STRVZ|nr:hypothetical protein [Streptomyces venezuelae]QES58000.1 hypothetical protein DEJ51_30800 [Streptomyces venezuelae]
MAIPTSFEIVHSCGHSNTLDLSSRSADQRAGYARWLATRQCTDCWRADHQADAASTAEWLAAKRADEQAAAADWATQFDMPPLEGPEKILGWAEHTRHQLVTRAYTALVTEGTWDEAEWAQLEEQVRLLTRAGWWVDQREAEGTDLPELLEAADDGDQPTENPFR